MNSHRLVSYLPALVACALVGCDDEGLEPKPHKPAIPNLDLTVLQEGNLFVHQVMTDFYYWKSQMPELDSVEWLNYESPSKLFAKYKVPADRFSFMSTDAAAYLSQDAGEFLDCGWDYQPCLVSEGSDAVECVLRLVIPGSPAWAAGAQRGDKVRSVDGQSLRNDAFWDTMLKGGHIGAIRRVDGQETTIEYDVKAAAYTESPVQYPTLLTTEGGSKVGYIYYSNFNMLFNERAAVVVDSLKTLGATEMVVDLRYDRGGDVAAMQCLASLLAPTDKVKNAEVLQRYMFNEDLRSKYPEQYGDGGSETTLKFLPEYADRGLGLQRCFFLCDQESYSASESLVWSLQPYMETILVGQQTGGKNTMMFRLLPSDYVDDSAQVWRAGFSPRIDNLMLQPIVAVCANAQGASFDTSDGRGLRPTAGLEVDELKAAEGWLKPLGTPDEPLLAAALHYIDHGTPPGENDNKAVTIGRNKALTLQSTTNCRHRGGLVQTSHNPRTIRTHDNAHP